jgi:molybdopterin/thiamine biosynthesis adenylyltransferase
MAMNISTRHEGDLNNQLLPFLKSGRTAVTLVMDNTASSIAVQHTAWMCVNLLARLDGCVEQISICCPPNITVHANVFPFSVETSDFGSALVVAAGNLEIVPVTAGRRIGIEFYIGPGVVPKTGWRVYGDGWCGGITKSHIIKKTESDLPFGPYIAASEIFKRMRMRPEHYATSEGFYDAWRLATGRFFQVSGPQTLSVTGMKCTLAGIGAVGNAFLHAIAACPKLQISATLADNDSKGIDLSNLNRYVLFGKSAVGKRKPDAVCELLQLAHLQLTPWNDAAEKLPDLGDHVLSAVDTNRAREGIQFRYPARIISASTLDLRAEVLNCGPPGKGACLRCYNPPESLPTDEELVAGLKAATEEQFVQFCNDANVSIEDGRGWVVTQKCGQEGERLLSVLRQRDDASGVFAVGFTSVLAGILLATEFIKDHIGAAAALTGMQNHAVMQFFDILSPANSPSFIACEQYCPACNAGRPGLPIWQRRFTSLMSSTLAGGLLRGGKFFG